MLLLADRNFAVTAVVEQIASAHADLLIRSKDAGVCCPDQDAPGPDVAGTDGPVTVRVIDARIGVPLARWVHPLWSLPPGILFRTGPRVFCKSRPRVGRGIPAHGRSTSAHCF